MWNVGNKIYIISIKGLFAQDENYNDDYLKICVRARQADNFKIRFKEHR